MSTGFRRYLVGGAVRDRLLGLPVKERDWVVVGSTPEEMLEAAMLVYLRGLAAEPGKPAPQKI